MRDSKSIAYTKIAIMSIVMWMVIFSIAQADEWNYSINPEGSNFTFDELRDMLVQDFAMISRASNHTFLPVTETTTTTAVYPNKIIRFRPASEFSNPTVQALAASGIKFNILAIQSMDLKELKWLSLHELGHNMSLQHTGEPFSVMSTYKWRSVSDKSMWWRHDLIDLHTRAPKTPNPVAYITVDEDISIMIPSIVIGTDDYSVRLRYHPLGPYWRIHQSEINDDGATMVPQARLLSGDILELESPQYLGIEWPTVKLQINGDKFTLIP